MSRFLGMSEEEAEQGKYFPTRQDMVKYLEHYERSNELQVHRPLRCESVTEGDEGVVAHVSSVGSDAVHQSIRARALISCTGTYECPVVPVVPGCERFSGIQVRFGTNI